jgi:hypothetical protein
MPAKKFDCLRSRVFPVWAEFGQVVAKEAHRACEEKQARRAPYIRDHLCAPASDQAWAGRAGPLKIRPDIIFGICLADFFVLAVD